MYRADVIDLIHTEYITDSIGQPVPHECCRRIYCQLDSVTQTEWFNAGHAGLKAEYRASVFFGDYMGEEIAIVHGHKYGIYRTYRRADDTMELYLERKAGV